MLWVNQVSRIINKLYIEMEFMNHCDFFFFFFFLHGHLLLTNEITVLKSMTFKLSRLIFMQYIHLDLLGLSHVYCYLFRDSQ